MKITKYGHCTLLIEIDKVRILTDPGIFSEGFEELEKIDAVLITHEHSDHLHVESLKKIIAKNPSVEVFSNHSVGKILREVGISFVPMGDNEAGSIKGVPLEGCGKNHAEIYDTFGLVENTGFIIANLLYYPGDSFYIPETKVPILAAPIYGPWMKISECIDFIREYNPLFVFPVHDAPLNEKGYDLHQRLIKSFLKEETKFISLRNVGDNHKFEIK